MRLKEGLKAGDLEGVVNRRFSIDQFKSKMGEDRNIMVLSFVVDGLEPAKDLERFAETKSFRVHLLSLPFFRGY